MELFAESENHIYIALLRILHAMQEGRRFYRYRDKSGQHDDLIEALHDGFDYSRAWYADDEESERQLLNILFQLEKQPDGWEEYRLVMPVEVSRQPERRELVWLKALLLNRSARFPIPDTLAKKLLHRLAGVPEADLQDIWQRFDDDAPQAPDDSACRILTTFLQACLRGHTVMLQSCGEEAIKAYPCRLEYDLSRSSYMLYIWEVRSDTLRRIPLASVQAIQELDELVPDHLYERLEQFYDAHHTSVTIEIQNTRNTVERCFQLFSPYDKEAHVDDALQTYQLTIYYYDFDTEDVLSKLFSFGPYLTVLAPEPMRDALIRRLQETYALYAEDDE